MAWGEENKYQSLQQASKYKEVFFKCAQGIVGISINISCRAKIVFIHLYVR